MEIVCIMIHEDEDKREWRAVVCPRRREISWDSEVVDAIVLLIIHYIIYPESVVTI